MDDRTKATYFGKIISSGNIAAAMHDIARHIAQITLKKLVGLDTLHPEMRRLAVLLVAAAKDAGLNIAIANCFRDFTTQDSLYAQGRTLPGGVVTNAKAGQSYHNYGLAFDVRFTDGQPYPADHALWAKLGAIGETLGLAWGGSFGDNPHFELHDGFSWSDIMSFFTTE